MLLRAILLVFLILVIFVARVFATPIPQRQIDANFKPKYGISYSFEQAGWYGLNPRGAYVKMLDEFKLDWVRLPFSWNQMALLRSPGASDGQARYEFNDNFEDLKFAIEEAKKRNIKVIIALGVKTPYYPEYHWPKEIASQVKFGEKITISHPIASEILAIDKKVVETLADYDNIAFWQVENEPQIANVNKWEIDPSLIAREVEVVRRADPKKRSIILNHAAVGFWDNSWQSLLSILKKGDVFAVNAFFKTKGTDLITANFFGHETHLLWPDHFVWPVHSWGLLSPNLAAMKKKSNKAGLDFWILEMQAEPYIKKLEETDDPVLSFRVEDINMGDIFLKSYQIDSVGLWGVHFWQYRQKLGDDSWVESVKNVINKE